MAITVRNFLDLTGLSHFYEKLKGTDNDTVDDLTLKGLKNYVESHVPPFSVQFVENGDGALELVYTYEETT